MLALLATAALAQTQPRLDAAWSEAWAAPELAFREGYSDLVAELARAAPSGRIPADAAPRAAALGLAVQQEGDALWLVELAPRGVGLVALRLGPLPDELVLTAPHPRSDQLTGRITAAMFDAGGVRAAAIATNPRDVDDPAHDPLSGFHLATVALAEALPSPLVVQLHGFGEAHGEAAFVVSPGASRQRPAVVAAARDRLSPALGAGMTGADVPELAGRTNVQGRALVGERFVHLELDLATRERLKAEAEVREAFSAALHDLATGPEPRWP